MQERALSDLKVLEYGEFINGPYCAKLMGDMGAEVIKIEEPGSGDEARRHEPFYGNVPHAERSGLFLYLNTSKLGITLNLKTATGAELFKQLVKNADVLIENRPPGLMSELGLGYEVLRKINPRLVMTSITPFGQSGPYKNYKAHDLNLWHIGGMGYITKEERHGNDLGPPVKGGGRQADFTAGLTAAIATMCALYSRQMTGRGQWIDVSEMECISSLPQAPLAFPSLEGRIVGKFAEPLYPGGIMNCKDGEVLIRLVEEGQWCNLFDLMGNPEWTQGDWWMDRQARVDSSDFLNSMVAEWAAQHTVGEILSGAQEKHIPVAGANTAEDIVKDKQFKSREFFVEIEHPETGRIKYPSAGYKLSESPWCGYNPAPLLGQHNNDIYCQRLGYSAEDLVYMRESGVI